jgi:hypothetical protein
MDFTFGIITDGRVDNIILQIINSIEEQNIPNYEIIIVGNSKISGNNINVINFDESIKRAWITKKKNIICQNAKYENIVLLHDYVLFDKDWYKGFLKFGHNFKYCITQIKTIDGKRFRDYTLYPFGLEPLFQDNCLLPYSYNPSDDIRKLLYISGTYYIIKKDIALQYPLNEDLIHGGSEDVEISQRLATNNIHITCNSYSTVSYLKSKPQCNWENELTKDQIIELDSLDNNTLNILFKKQKNHLNSWIKSTQGVFYKPY